jgi:Right handed beta helix region
VTPRTRTAAIAAVLLCAVALPVTASASTSPPQSTEPPSSSAGGATLAVPADYATIQAAVDAAAPGDLVLVSPGVYNEAVNVTTPELTIRGLDRNEVVLDGEFELDNGIRVLGAGGVAVENMTARNYTFNGFFWTGVDGYRGSYLTAYRNGDYGVYAFDSIHGLFEHSYAAGSPDAGFYIGQCYPCDAVLDDVHAEHNGLGYSGTNAGGNLLIVNSRFNNNRAGIVPNSGSYELCYPQRETTIVGNLVYSNNQADTPAIGNALLAMGNGILPAGGVGNIISRNRVWDHDLTGIGLIPFPEEQALDDQPSRDEWDTPCTDTRDDPVSSAPPELLLWDSYDNVVTDNVVEDSRLADLAVGTLSGDPATAGNCFAGNTFTTSAPADLEALAPCEGSGEGDWSAGALDLGALIAATEDYPPSVDYEQAELPELAELENLPDAATAPATPATGMPPALDLDAIAVPDAPAE